MPTLQRSLLQSFTFRGARCSLGETSRPQRMVVAVCAALVTLLAGARSEAQETPTIKVRVNCSATSTVQQTITGEGCFAITASGPSYVELSYGLTAQVFPTNNCSGGVSTEIAKSTSLCSLTFNNGAATNEVVRSVLIRQFTPQANSKRIDGVVANVAIQAQRTDGVEEDVAALQADASTLSSSVTMLKTRTDKLESDVTALKGRGPVSAPSGYIALYAGATTAGIATCPVGYRAIGGGSRAPGYDHLVRVRASYPDGRNWRVVVYGDYTNGGGIDVFIEAVCLPE